jgi:hypothetical protein
VGTFVLISTAPFPGRSLGEVLKNPPRDISWLTFKPIGHEDQILVILVRGREDVSSLEGLREVAEDIIDVEDGFRGIGWAGDVYSLDSLVIDNGDEGGDRDGEELSRTYKSSSLQSSRIYP